MIMLQETAGIVDSSGVGIFYTPIIRQYDAGVLTLGDPLLGFWPIPPGEVAVPYETSCPSECTDGFPHDINVIGSFQHMHNAGSQMYSTHWRNDTFLGDLNRVDFYDFDFQQNTLVSTTIRRGDRLNTHCVYNTLDRNTPTSFGVDSIQEMCMEFVTYYPLMLTDDGPYVFCGRTPRFANITWCGNYDPSGIKFDLPNPDILDPTWMLNKTFGILPTECAVEPSPAKSSSPAPGTWWNRLSTSARAGVIVGPLVGFAIVIAVVAFLVIRKRQSSYQVIKEN